MIDDDTFRRKYYDVVDVFKKWMPGRFDMSKSTILDFGCEHGIMALGFAQRLKPSKVIGIDTQDCFNDLLDIVKARADINSLPLNLEFYQIAPGEKLSSRFKFNVIFAWSVFEHIDQLIIDDVISDLHDSLSDNGWIFIQIAPLYYSPYGSHLESLINMPWAHLQLQHDILHNIIMNISKDVTIYRTESDENFTAIKRSIWNCYITLNRITADGIINLFESKGFTKKKEFRTKTDIIPPKSLCDIYSKKILQTEQIVALFQKPNSVKSVPENNVSTCSNNIIEHGKDIIYNSCFQSYEKILNTNINRKKSKFRKLYIYLSAVKKLLINFIGKFLQYFKG